ncbi:GNAT family N-acetyltransferase [Gleimia sp. 6138-11-ORH1]|uniref:GNAT family N-acetyltransferase n=1 Tax=Gleimia sp. 6138-11-ORH1 TaxID=2973937 RepID=UPI002167EC04|nr:GNAT family N-acetyltransferase [Gleimia sp. 6138-11-ORH1]MCS4484574.1 GNAT family N-acetyltransferase [Gleimia sp. 6138-11-ORH1]
MSSKITYRQLGPADLFQVIELEPQIFPADAWTESMLTEELTLPDRLYLGAFQADTLIGYAGVRLGIDSDVMTVGILPSQRGKGLGTALVKELINQVKKIRFAPEGKVFFQDEKATEVEFISAGQITRPVRRVEKLILEVRISNQPAIVLYEKLGFEKVGQIKRYYRNPVEDALVMILELKEKPAHL